MEEFRTVLSSNGRIVIPAYLTRVLDLQPGDEVVFTVDKEGIHLNSPVKALARLQELFATHNKKRISLSNELMKSRRGESKYENLIVLDASALLALLNNEPGLKKVIQILPKTFMSSVNLSEVIFISLKPVLTADKAWSRLNVNIDIQLIR